MSAQDAIQKIYQQWSQNLGDTKQLFDNLKHVLGKDDSITREYRGLNSILVSSNFTEFMGQFETSLQMGNQLLILMLEKLKTAQQGHYATRNGLSQRDLVESAN